MIDVIKQTPDVYSYESRDYQLLARLFTALYNSSKVYADNMNVWGTDIDNKLSVLRARTLNFKTKHNWDYDALDATVSCFKYVMRVKGTVTALLYCIYLLMRTYKLVDEYYNEVQVTLQDNTFIIMLPELLVTIGIVQDLLDHVMPAGTSYRVIRYKSIDESGTTTLAGSQSYATSSILTPNLGIYNGDTTDETHQGYTIYRTSVIDEANEE